MEHPPSGWHGYKPAPPIVVASSGGPVDSPLADGHRFELNIYESPTGFWRWIMDWADESQMEFEHPTLDAAREHAANLVQDHSLNWEPWRPPGEDGA